MRDSTASLVRHAIVAESGVSATVWTSEIVIGVEDTVVVGVGSALVPLPVSVVVNGVVSVGPGVDASAKVRSGVKATTSLRAAAALGAAGALVPPSSGDDDARLDRSSGTRPGCRFAFL
jgi:hypothetical protein